MIRIKPGKPQRFYRALLSSLCLFLFFVNLYGCFAEDIKSQFQKLQTRFIAL